ncbi:unnamed protein product [Lampetra planeri]
MKAAELKRRHRRGEMSPKSSAETRRLSPGMRAPRGHLLHGMPNLCGDLTSWTRWPSGWTRPVLSVTSGGNLSRGHAQGGARQIGFPQLGRTLRIRLCPADQIRYMLGAEGGDFELQDFAIERNGGCV